MRGENKTDCARGAGFSLCMGMLLLLLFTSCIPEPLEVKEIPVVKPEIVVATQLLPNGGLVVLLTRTFGALEASDDSDPEDLLNQIAVNDALVTIKGNQGTDTLAYQGSGIYGGLNIPFEEGENYELYVISESLGEVSATTTVQPQVLFQNVKAELYYNGFGDTLAEISYSIKDPLGINRYLVNVQEVERKDLLENVLNPRAFIRLLDDTEFDGWEYHEEFRVFPRDYEPGDTIAVSLSNLSEPYYQFLKFRADNRYSFVEYLGEPIDYPTNVVGGRGFFNLYIPDFRFFVFGEGE